MIVEIGTVNTGYWVEISNRPSIYNVEITKSPGETPTPSVSDVIFSENSIILFTENNMDLMTE